MLAVGVQFLCHWSMAAGDGAAKRRAEWPPHPDRLFMALTAALFEGDCGAECEQALGWLETQGAPSLRCSDATVRAIVTSFVPVNDTASAPAAKPGKRLSAKQVSQGLALLPQNRSRQPRQFPVAIPTDPVVHYIWPHADPSPDQLAALHRVALQVTCVGHPASLVQAWVDQTAPPATLRPTPGVGTNRLRVPESGRLGTLKARYNQSAISAWQQLQRQLESARGKEKTGLKETLKAQFPNGEPQRLHPDQARYQDYLPVQDPDTASTPACSLFDPNLIVLRRDLGRPLDLRSTLALAAAMHKTLIARCRDPAPEWVSGHTTANGASDKPHIAILPMAHVGHEHADGHLLGLALAMPRNIPEQEVGDALGWLRDFDDQGQPAPIRVFQGRRFDWQLRLETRDFPAQALSAQTWVRPARYWASVTPLAFNRHSKGNDPQRHAAQMIAAACTHIGLPPPASVMLTQVSPFIGVPHQREFPPKHRKRDGGAMYHSHLILDFGRAVQGPVVLGAGRYRGYGLMRPLNPPAEYQL